MQRSAPLLLLVIIMGVGRGPARPVGRTYTALFAVP